MYDTVTVAVPVAEYAKATRIVAVCVFPPFVIAQPFDTVHVTVNNHFYSTNHKSYLGILFFKGLPCPSIRLITP